MGHRNARLTVHGRLLLVQRVRVEGMPVAHVAKAMGISRQCASRWVGEVTVGPTVDVVDRPGPSTPLGRDHALPVRGLTAAEAVAAHTAEDRPVGRQLVGGAIAVDPRQVVPTAPLEQLGQEGVFSHPDMVHPAPSPPRHGTRGFGLAPGVDGRRTTAHPLQEIDDDHENSPASRARGVDVRVR